MQGESAATSGYHAANADVGQTEDQMVEATIGALSNLATTTVTYRGVVAPLTEANARLAKQLEDNASELRDLKALLKKERTERRGQRIFNPSPKSTAELMVTRWPTLTPVSVATFPIRRTSGRPVGLTSWAAVRLTRNDVKGRQL
jgi:hypothetical protein